MVGKRGPVLGDQISLVHVTLPLQLEVSGSNISNTSDIVRWKDDGSLYNS